MFSLGSKRKKHQQKPREEESDLTMDEFQKLVGKMMRASQEANWEKKKKAEQDAAKSTAN
ncbi:MAG: hypothetical protein F4227_02635 [Gammaproteobacteria bacterium]|nr:hypothetical protein [Gammaproteobacteria bacterium]MYF01894.1 hypothetical protein [Gammaproteobacteria bacterium]MYI76412.1 hypothetical protein [Gammaproteobacteria bacterium]